MIERLFMVAPNGARRGKADHEALPVGIAEIAREAGDCQKAGAGAIHLHVRDAGGGHVLDAGLYREAMAEIAGAAPGMVVQVTTEAVGRYTPEQQVALARDLRPGFLSAALKEFIPGESHIQEAGRFYAWARDEGIGVQHILYSPDDVRRFAGFVEDGTIPGNSHSILFVVGRYASGGEGDPGDLAGFVAALGDCGMKDRCHWTVCGFGQAETAVAAASLAMGGHVRVGFENGLVHADGTKAASNAERVERVVELARHLAVRPASGDSVRKALGAPGLLD